MRRLLVAGLAVLLVSCRGNIPPPKNFLPTTTPLSATTAAPASLTDGDLEPLLIADGDLPAGYTLVEQPTPQPHPIYIALPPADAQLTQAFENLEDLSGWASIALYHDQTLQTNAYSKVARLGAGGIALEGIGEQGAQNTTPLLDMPSATVTFIRCEALVILQGSGNTKADPAVLLAWAKKIDQRIQTSVICQK